MHDHIPPGRGYPDHLRVGCRGYCWGNDSRRFATASGLHGFVRYSGGARRSDEPTGGGERVLRDRGRQLGSAFIERVARALVQADSGAVRQPHDVLGGLARSYLFEGLSPADLAPLAAVVSTRELVRGEALCRVGDRADEIYVVLSGELKDCVVDAAGVEVVHFLHGPGMTVGEPGVLRGRPSPHRRGGRGRAVGGDPARPA